MWGRIVFWRISGKGGEDFGWNSIPTKRARSGTGGIPNRAETEEGGRQARNVRLYRFDLLSAWYKRKSLKFTISGF
jgi:hypothetical protein